MFDGTQDADYLLCVIFGFFKTIFVYLLGVVSVLLYQKYNREAPEERTFAESIEITKEGVTRDAQIIYEKTRNFFK